MIAPRISYRQILDADQANIRLEIQGDLHLWEVSPGFRHQQDAVQIYQSIRPIPSDRFANRCGCVPALDVLIAFPDGSIKRPDIAVFCEEPVEQYDAITRMPEAVIEVVSPRYEAKDLELGPPFYLLHGIKDVVVFDRMRGKTVHFRRDQTVEHDSPVTIDLECGSRCTV
jgi:Uma2 family endonuclease